MVLVDNGDWLIHIGCCGWERQVVGRCCCGLHNRRLVRNIWLGGHRRAPETCGRPHLPVVVGLIGTGLRSSSLLRSPRLWGSTGLWGATSRFLNGDGRSNWFWTSSATPPIATLVDCVVQVTNHVTFVRAIGSAVACEAARAVGDAVDQVSRRNSYSCGTTKQEGGGDAHCLCVQGRESEVLLVLKDYKALVLVLGSLLLGRKSRWTDRPKKSFLFINAEGCEFEASTQSI